MSSPYLSIVVTGRNDGYGGDFNQRFFRALRFNHDKLRAAGVEHEVVLVEWAPPADAPLLADLIAAGLPDIAPSVLTSYVVDPRYQHACTLNPQMAYLEYVAKNVGLRRARGRFLLATNTDIYLSLGVVEALAAAALEPGVVYRATRTDVKLGADESHVDWPLLDDERNHATYKKIQPPLYAGGSGDFILLDRDSFHSVRGFNEVYRLARLGVDVNFLVKAYASGYRIADIGFPVYHTNHVGSFRISKSVVQNDAANTRWGRQEWPSHDVIYENWDGWGLREAPETAMRPGVTRLEFSWAAVPPLVDLKRIVLPAKRVGQE